MTTPAAPSPRARLIHDIVSKEGYVPQFNEQGTVLFKVEGKFFSIPDDDEQSFIRVIHQRFRLVKDEAERPRLMSAAVEVSGSVKVAKVYVGKTEVWAVAELFCWPTARFATAFPRSLRVLNYAVKEFEKKFKG